jgi:glycosyltransferase involved in cell wall biosynthesis
LLNLPADQDFELVIVDGGSKDNTLELLQPFQSKIGQLVSEKDNGIYDAWNKGLHHSSGDWIIFLGADDRLLEKTLEKYIKFIHKNKSFDLITSKIKLSNRIVGQKWNIKLFKKYMNIAHIGAMHNRKIFDRFGYFNESYKIAGDYEFLLRCYTEIKVGFIDFTAIEAGEGGIGSGYTAIYEAFRAKISTGKRPKSLALFETIIAVIKLSIHKLSSNL